MDKTKEVENPFEKYNDSKGFLLFARPTKDRNYKIVFAKRKHDYVLATSVGEEFPISYETLDKVRDVLSGNMTGLTEYEDNFFKKFNYEMLLKTMARESVFRHFEKEGKSTKGLGLDLLLLDQFLDPAFMMPLREKRTEEEEILYKKRKDSIEKMFQDKFDIKIEAGRDTFTKVLMKLTSDQSFGRKKFLKDALKKKKK